MRKLIEIYRSIPFPRPGEYSGRLYCPCEHIYWNNIEKALKNKRSKILDIGCGPGLKSFVLSKKHKVIGFDVDKKQVGAWKKYNCNLFLASAEEIPIKTKSFDTILCTEVLEHVKDYKKLLNDVLRIIKKQGRIIITTPNAATNRSGEKYGHFKEFRIEELKKLFQKNNLRINYYFFTNHNYLNKLDKKIHWGMKMDAYAMKKLGIGLPKFIIKFYNKKIYPRLLKKAIREEEELKQNKNGLGIFMVVEKLR